MSRHLFLQWLRAAVVDSNNELDKAVFAHLACRKLGDLLYVTKAPEAT